MKMLKTTHLFLPIVFMGMLAGCAYEMERIAIAYEPLQVDSIAALEEDLHLSLEIRDQRRTKNYVSKKIGSHGEGAAEIKLDRHLKEEIVEAVETELKQRGFTFSEEASPEDVKIKISIQKFFNDFKPGKWLAKSGAELIIDVLVSQNGKAIYEKTITGEGKHEKIWAYSGKNAKIPLDEAFNDGIHQLLRDPSFLEAISKRATSSPL